MGIPVCYERMRSRSFAISRNDSSFSAEYLVAGSDNESEVKQSVFVNAPESFLGMYRDSIKCTPRGMGYWDAVVDYKNIPAADALKDDSPGESTPPAESPASNDAPLGSGYGFTTTGNTTHITQSLRTVSKTVRIPMVAPDFKQAIGVTLEGVEGCDIITPNFEFYREVRRNGVSLNYLRTLMDLTGTTNDQQFYGHATGEVLYLGCEGKYSSNEAWTLTHRFAVSRNKVNIIISDEITVPAKKGWEYLWVDYLGGFSEGRKIRRPTTAVVEQVYRAMSFAALEIGT